MFPRRRRPLLGAAVVVGASRSAAKHEVQQAQLAASNQQQAQWERDRQIQLAADEAVEKHKREEEMKRREEEERQRQTQAAIDIAILKDRSDLQKPGIVQPAFGVAPMPQPPIASQFGMEQSYGIGMRYCTACGEGCDVQHKFCAFCGAKLV